MSIAPAACMEDILRLNFMEISRTFEQNIGMSGFVKSKAETLFFCERNATKADRNASTNSSTI